MPKYYGCPCEGCGKPLTLQDDIVVCPDCGAPYHRDCYEKLGRCIHAPAHAAGYEWKFPYQESELCTCPACGERTLRSESVCRSCGAALPPEGAQEPADRADSDEHSEEFDYSTFYRQFQETGAPGLSTSTLLTLSRVCSVLSFLLMIVRGLYGKWLYRQSAAEKIRRIRAEFPDAAQRKAVLCAQGGTSWAAVLGCLVLLMVIGSAFTLLLGPNVDALIHLVYG